MNHRMEEQMDYDLRAYGHLMAKHLSECKYTRAERRWICGGRRTHKHTVRAFNRADRQGVRKSLKSFV
jgi:hypothetical protein